MLRWCAGLLALLIAAPAGAVAIANLNVGFNLSGGGGPLGPVNLALTSGDPIVTIESTGAGMPSFSFSSAGLHPQLTAGGIVDGVGSVHVTATWDLLATFTRAAPEATSVLAHISYFYPGAFSRRIGTVDDPLTEFVRAQWIIARASTDNPAQGTVRQVQDGGGCTSRAGDPQPPSLWGGPPPSPYINHLPGVCGGVPDSNVLLINAAFDDTGTAEVSLFMALDIEVGAVGATEVPAPLSATFMLPALVAMARRRHRA